LSSAFVSVSSFCNRDDDGGSIILKR
jgi:hypothetical protein